MSLELETTPPRMEAARYDGGQGEKSYGSALRLWQDKLPDQWIVLTRDLFADFGSLDVTAISLGCPDGEAALFDHIYFARNPDDYNLIPSAPSPDITNQKAKQELAKQIVERTAPAMVTIALPDGRIIGGVCLRKRGRFSPPATCSAVPTRTWSCSSPTASKPREKRLESPANLTWGSSK